jgi:transcriptional regulator of heat shock response
VLKLQQVNAEVGRRLAKLLAESSDQASFALLPGETSTVGLANILDNPALPAEDAKEIARFFDNIDEHAEGMIKNYSGQSPKAVIGKEVKLSENSDYSMIVSGQFTAFFPAGIISRRHSHPSDMAVWESGGIELGRLAGFAEVIP